MPADKLTDPKVRQAKAANKPYKLFDGGGLFSLGRDIRRPLDRITP